MTFIFPSSEGESSIKRNRPLLTKVLSATKSCFNQYNAPVEKYVKLIQQSFSYRKKFLIVCQFSSISNSYEWLFVQWRYTIMINCLYQSGSLHTLFFYRFFVQWRHKNSSIKSEFSKAGMCYISIELRINLLRELLGFVCTAFFVLILILASEICFQ